MGKVKEMQGKIQEAQAGLVNIKVTAEAGAGMVKATVNGAKQVVSLEIDPDLFKPEDQETLKDLIIAAVNKGLKEADEKAKEEMREATKGMMPNIPGFDLGNMGA